MKYFVHFKYICLIFLALCMIDLWPLLGVRTYTELRASIPDEAMFYEQILSVTHLITTFNLAGILHFGTPFGYGYMYWLLMGIIGVPFTHLTYEDGILLFRLVSVFFKAIMIYYLYRTIRIHADVKQALLGVLLIFAMPGYWFYGKVLSPEFILLGILAISIYYLVRDNMKVRRDFWISLIVFSLALSIKISIAPLISLYALIPLYKLIESKDYANWKRIKLIIVTPTSAIALFFLFNFTVFTKLGWNDFVNWLNYNKGNSFSPSWERIQFYYQSNVPTWDRIANAGMKIDYMNFWLFLVFTGIIIVSWVLGNRNKIQICLYAAASMLLLFILSTQVTFSWYLMAPFLVFVVAISITSKPNYKIQVAMFLAIVVLLSVNGGRIYEKYMDRMKINQEIHDNYLKGYEIQEYLKTQQATEVIADPFLAVPDEELSNPIATGAGTLYNLTQFNPNLFKLYPNVQWMIVTKDEGDQGDKNSWNKLINDGLIVEGKTYKFKFDKEFPTANLYKKVLP